MSKEKQIEEITCERCLHRLACLVNGEYVPTPCPAYEDKADYHKQSEWISVGERLPEEPRRVLVYIVANHLNEVAMDTDRFIGRWVRWGTLVSHWMPLPEAPKMKGGAE